MQAIQLVNTKEMSREDWLAWRRRGIGGSDAAAIMGASPFASPLSVYYDKTGEAPERDETEAMRQGVFLEQYVADRFTEETGLKVRRRNAMLQHPQYPWMLANIDREVVGENAGLECKTTSMLNPSDFEGGEVPLSYPWQCAHYMAVTGKPRWYVAVLVLSKAFYVFKVEWDDRIIAPLIEKERQFWHEHVLARVPPYPNGSDADGQIINALYAGNQTDDAVDLSGVKDTLDLLPLLKREKDLADSNYDAARQRVQLALGSSVYGHADGWTASNKAQTRETISGKRLKAAHPDIFDQYVSRSTFTKLIIKEA